MITTALLLAALLAVADTQPVAFVEVNVLPMDRERILERYTVIVRNGRIESLGPMTDIAVPADARRIDGRGKYLMPGLAEMHGHLPNPSAPGATPEVTEAVLFLYLANGVTAVRGMQGNPAALELRDRIARREVLGPRLWVAGQPFSGNSARTVADARRMVREQKAQGFDLLKIHEGLSRAIYDTIARAAKRVSIPFGGHVPDDVGLFHALRAGQITIDHLDNYVEAAGGTNAGPTGIDSVVQATRSAGAWVVPTLALWATFLAGDAATLGGLPELRYVPAQWTVNWTQQVRAMRQNNPDVTAGLQVIALRGRILKALSDAGAHILLGTDSPQLFSVPGFSVHHEIQAMREAGLTPYQILESGTRRVAEYFGASEEFGTVETGRRADLVLLSGNPLQDLGALARPAGVMVNGTWLPQPEIEQRLSRIAERFAR
jgi:hypothetical protein